MWRFSREQLSHTAGPFFLPEVPTGSVQARRKGVGSRPPGGHRSEKESGGEKALRITVRRRPTGGDDPRVCAYRRGGNRRVPLPWAAVPTGTRGVGEHP